MALDARYRGSYPRAGQVALLCEGDVLGYEVVALDRVLVKLKESWARWRSLQETPPNVDAVALFEETYAEWGSVAGHSPEWLLAWAGKEVLQYAEMLLAARFGWPAPDGTRGPIAWGALSAEACGQAQRDIEHALCQDLCTGLVAWLRDDPTGTAAVEWQEVASSCRAARDSWLGEA